MVDLLGDALVGVYVGEYIPEGCELFETASLQVYAGNVFLDS